MLIYFSISFYNNLWALFLLIYFWMCRFFIPVCELSLVAESRAYPLVAVCEILIMVASFIVEHRLEGSQASVVAAHGLSSCELVGARVQAQ